MSTEKYSLTAYLFATLVGMIVFVVVVSCIERCEEKTPVETRKGEDVMISRHPIQPLVTDNKGTLRFKENTIVKFLLESSPHDLNGLAVKGFNDEDWEQFAQLIGYSLDGFSELSYVSEETYHTAKVMSSGKDEMDARIEVLRKMLSAARKATRELVSALFRNHPDDLEE